MNPKILRLLTWAGIAVISLATAGCSSLPSVKTDPFYADFFEKTSLLMTEDEIELYIHLPDRESKAEFIEDFWKIRDPDPYTAENENRGEFNRRIRFANEWFGLVNRARPKPAPPSLHRERGWDTNRGVAYIVMGPPDSIGMSSTMGARDVVNPEDGYRLATAIAWYYERFRSQVYFSSTESRITEYVDAEAEKTIMSQNYYKTITSFRSLSTNTDLMKRAQTEWISRDHVRGVGDPLRFQAAYADRSLNVLIPIKTVRFRENEDKTLTASYAVEIRVYRNNRKVDTLSARKAFSFGEKDAEALERLEIRVPFDPPGKGRYLFDVIVKADDPSFFSRRREYVRTRI